MYRKNRDEYAKSKSRKLQKNKTKEKKGKKNKVKQRSISGKK